ncbi:magnesium transporter CorA family protein [Pseudorhodobacter ferrugineus]|uniref:magnesium transporter CorA family protein n=1 Tax=Pseudorhodobacter ferrugineus TaxID=77008 RepID=UPI0003B62EB8|nr:magnesium transporter CorA family protein [Pseudorhodobacter ferrugineus]
MIFSYSLHDGVLTPTTGDLETALWLDLDNPTAEEEAAVEAALRCNIPTQAEMNEIEISSRLYTFNHSTFMTAILPANSDSGDPVMGPVSFVLTPSHLVTVRYHNPRVFVSFPPRAHATQIEMDGPSGVLVGLMEAVIDRQADILERAAAEIDAQSRGVFLPVKCGKNPDYQKVLEKIGQMGNLNSNIRDSLLTLDRLVTYLGQVLTKQDASPDLRERARTLASDVKSLTDHANFVASKITFLLDATLGLINIEQNSIFKIFSVVSVIFLPPTLIASMFGMNFAHMPELQWAYGYPYAIGLMVTFAVLPFLYFKYKKWL